MIQDNLVDMLKARAEMYACIRDFFRVRDVLEVETPILSQAATTDVHLASVAVLRHMAGAEQMGYLQTSPEFAMKRLLAAGSGAIYQICKVFRDDEHGRRHNSEFSMLEWYRPSFDLSTLMLEVQDLLACCLGGDLRFERLSYKRAFYERLGLNPLSADLVTLKAKAAELGLYVDLGDARLAYVDLLFSHVVEPTLGKDGSVVFLCDFPPALASLAKIATDADGEQVASRFEVYINGLELANAYDELADAKELEMRFMADNAERRQLGLPVMPIDKQLLAALPNMPACSGIALGLDRLLMLKMGVNDISKVLTFSAQDA